MQTLLLSECLSYNPIEIKQKGRIRATVIKMCGISEHASVFPDIYRLYMHLLLQKFKLR